MATRIPFAFASAGDTENVPASSAGTELSWQQGWSPAYELNPEDPGYRFISRGQHNFLWNAITANVKEWQEQIYPDFNSSGLINYPIGSIIRLNDVFYIRVAGNGVSDPELSSDWSIAGQFTSADKAKLNGIQAGAQVNVATNLATTADATSRTITSSTGTNAVLPAATTTAAGVMTAADKSKLNGIQAGAQKFGVNYERLSRVPDVVYTNNRTYPIVVHIVLRRVSDTGVAAKFVYEESDLNVAAATAFPGSNATFSFIVPEGKRYRLIAPTSSWAISSWSELV